MRLKTFLLGALALLAGAAAPQTAGAVPALQQPVVEDMALQPTPVHSGIYWRKGYPWWNGYRGYPYHKPGFRTYGGYWFPHNAFAFGIIIAPQPRVRSYHPSQAHYIWCDNRYKTYRAWDNTFQPYHGPRKQCISPYLR